MNKVEKLKKKFSEKIEKIQSECPHENLEAEHGADLMNWSRSDDCFWIAYYCPDCSKRWRDEWKNETSSQNRVKIEFPV